MSETLDDCEFEIGSIKDSCYLRESSSIAVKSFALLLLLCWDCMRLVVEAEEQLLLSNVVKMLIRGRLDFLKRKKKDTINFENRGTNVDKTICATST